MPRMTKKEELKYRGKRYTFVTKRVLAAAAAAVCWMKRRTASGRPTGAGDLSGMCDRPGWDTLKF